MHWVSPIYSRVINKSRKSFGNVRSLTNYKALKTLKNIGKTINTDRTSNDYRPPHIRHWDSFRILLFIYFIASSSVCIPFVINHNLFTYHL